MTYSEKNSKKKISKKILIEKKFQKILKYFFQIKIFVVFLIIFAKVSIYIKMLLSFLENKTIFSQKWICLLSFFEALKKHFNMRHPVFKNCRFFYTFESNAMERQSLTRSLRLFFFQNLFGGVFILNSRLSRNMQKSDIKILEM